MDKPEASIKLSRAAYEHLVLIVPAPPGVRVVAMDDDHVTLGGSGIALAAWFRDAMGKIQ